MSSFTYFPLIQPNAPDHPSWPGEGLAAPPTGESARKIWRVCTTFSRKAHIFFNPQDSFRKHFEENVQAPASQKEAVARAMERATKEIMRPVVERSICIATTATVELVCVTSPRPSFFFGIGHARCRNRTRMVGDGAPGYCTKVHCQRTTVHRVLHFKVNFLFLFFSLRARKSSSTTPHTTQKGHILRQELPSLGINHTQHNTGHQGLRP